MNRIRNRLIAVFLAATLAPLAVTWWIATALLEHSVDRAPVDQIDQLSRTIQTSGRELYQALCESLKRDAESGRATPRLFTRPAPDQPDEVRSFWESTEPERFSFSETGPAPNTLQYLVRDGAGVRLYSRSLPDSSLGRLRAEFRGAREAVADARGRDLRGGLVRTFAALAAVIWTLSLTLLIFLAHRVSRPMQQLTAGLARLAAGDLSTRIPAGGSDETGDAIRAFNDTAAQLEHNRDRLVYLTQLASWRTLARKMAHEIKNSLTPIRLTVEEMVARRGGSDPQFLEQASRIVVDEVEGLERRVRAFSEFSAEPPVRPVDLNLNSVCEERVALLRAGHPQIHYATRLAGAAMARADEDLVRGTLTNLLENAAQAMSDRGTLLISSGEAGGRAWIEVHDSGPGLSEQARASLFEPTISFKKRGMGLGLSIARKNALLCGGDLELIESELVGAAFRLTLSAAPKADAPAPERPQDSPAVPDSLHLAQPGT